MALTDRRGRGLKAFLVAEVVGDDITMAQIRDAVGVKSARWYGDHNTAGRADAPDFPNPTELHRLARYFGLTDQDYVDLLVDFGWISTEVSPGFTGRQIIREPPPTPKRQRVRKDRPTL